MTRATNAGPPEAARIRGAVSPLQLARGPQANRDSRLAAWVGGVALIVLLIACANVANLLLSRAISRRREIAVRLALGVSRGRLMRQLLTESLVLAFLGGAGGLLIAQWGAPIVTGLAPAGLLVFQVALSTILLVGAGLFVRSLSNVHQYRLGYDADAVLVATVNARGVQLTDTQRIAISAQMLAVAGSLPGVSHAPPAASIPFWNNEERDIIVPGMDSASTRGRFLLQSGSPDYFATMGTRIVRGRAFDETDRAGTPLVAVVSEGMARVLWPERDAIGQCFKINADTVPCTTIIGIAEEMRLRLFVDEREYAYYVPAAQHGAVFDMQIMARTTGLARDFVPWFVAFGALALVLSAVGLYSLIAYDVAQRKRDLSVRIALGASVPRVIRLVLGHGVRLIVAGVVVGGGLALWAAPRIQHLIFQQSARDPAVFGAVVAMLVAVGCVAAAVPAMRAARVDPNIALREDIEGPRATRRPARF